MKIARRHFKNYGYNKTSMAKIAKDADLAVGTLYLYFSNKPELLKYTVEDFIIEHHEQSKEYLLSKKNASLNLINYLQKRFEAVSEVRGNEGKNSELNQKIFELFPSRRKEESDIMVHTVKQIIEVGVNRGEFSKNLIIDDELFVFMHSIAWFFLPTEEFFETRPSVKDLGRIIDWFIKKWKN